MSEPTNTEQDEKGRTKLSSVRCDTPLNIICHQDDIQIVNDRADVMEITPEDTLAMVKAFTPRVWDLARKDQDFVRRMRIVFPDLDLTTDDRPLEDHSIATRHVVGLIICTNKAINTGRTPFWRYPETYLHPRSQSKIAQLAIAYTKDAEDAAAAASAPPTP